MIAGLKLDSLPNEELQSLRRLLGSKTTTNTPTEVAAAHEAARAAGFVIGAKVDFKLIKGMTGEVTGYNHSTSFGVVPGNEAPVLVKRSDGYVFEHSLAELQLQTLPYSAGVLVAA